MPACSRCRPCITGEDMNPMIPEDGVDHTHFVEGALHPRGAPDAREEQSAFVLSCFRALGPAPAVARPMSAVQDWADATKALERHGLLPILGVAAVVGASTTPSIPAGVQQLAVRSKLRLALYQANTLDALADVSREMKAAGIPYAVLKGTYLYELLYRDLFPREYGDIDLLVPGDRIEDATVALRRAGYDGAGVRPGRPSMPRWHFHATLTSKKPGGLPIELHRSLVDKANLHRVRDADLFARLREFKARGRCFTVLSAEDQFIYLCLHAAKHGILNVLGLRGGYAAEWYCRMMTGNRLIWFLDIELFLRHEKENLDWLVVSERSQEWNVAEDVMNCLRVLALLQPASQAQHAMERLGGSRREAGPTTARRTGMMDRILRSSPGRALLERSMNVSPTLLIRPIRLFLIGRILAPSPTRLLRYHGRQSRLWLPWLYIIHPFCMLRKMLVS